MFATLPLADLAAARALYTGARDSRIAAALLERYGYDADDYETGLDLVEDVDSLSADQMREYAEQYAATGAARDALAATEALYGRHRRLATRRHPRGSAGYRALGLAGRVPRADAAFVATAGTFYRALTDDPTLADGIARVEAARTAMDTQARETGEAQVATRLRDDAVALLRAHAGGTRRDGEGSPRRRPRRDGAASRSSERRWASASAAPDALD